MTNLTFQPLMDPPTPDDLAGTVPCAPVMVATITHCDQVTGAPKFLEEAFIDPETNRHTVVWSRITTSLAYVQG